MNLAELLALIPDNDAGDIGADDLAAIVTALYNQPKLSFHTRWGYNAAVGGNPPNQDVVFNNADVGLATWARFSPNTKDNYDVDGVLLRAVAGTRIHFQDANDDTRWLRAEVTGAPSAVPGPPASVQVPIVKLASGLTTAWTGDLVVVFGVVPVV